MRKLERRLNHLEERFKITDEDIIGRMIKEYFEKYGSVGIEYYVLSVPGVWRKETVEDLKKRVNWEEIEKIIEDGAREDLLKIFEIGKELEKKRRNLI